MRKFLLFTVFASLLLCNLQAQDLPGGVTGATLWLRADKGVIKDGNNNLTGKLWTDNSQHDQEAVLVQRYENEMNKPLYVDNVVNFNPVVRFNGKVGLQANTNNNYMAVYAVYSANLTSENAFESTLISIKEDGITDYNSNIQDLAFFQTRKIGAAANPSFLYCDGVNNYWGTVNSAVVNKVTGFHSIFGAFGNPAGDMINFDGGIFSRLTRFTSTPKKTGLYTLGASARGTQLITKWLTGDIAEVIAFDYIPTDQERYQIESYLAMKYGITYIKTTSSSIVATPTNPDYAFNYYGGDGNTIWWPGESEEYKPYNTYVCGVVRDDISGLHQIKSKGRIGYTLTGNDAILTIANGGSYSNPETISTDGNYAVVGSTNDALGLIEMVFAKNTDSGREVACDLLKRKWKINSSGVEKLSLHFEFDAAMKNHLAETAKVGLYIASGNTSSFIPLTLHTDPLTLESTMTAEGVNLKTGDLFTVVLNYYDSPEIITKSQIVCPDTELTLSAIPIGGTWLGNGVAGSVFKAEVAGMGQHIITYNFNGIETSITITVAENIEPSVYLSASKTIVGPFDAVTITAITETGGDSPSFEFALDDPDFEYPLNEPSSKNTCVLAGYLLEEGDHIIYIRMQSSLSCAANTGYITDQITITKKDIINSVPEMIEDQFFTVYPTVFSNSISIKNSSMYDSFFMNIVDLSGRVILTGNYFENKISVIDTHTVKPGFYLLVINDKTTGKQLYTAKIIKK